MQYQGTVKTIHDDEYNNPEVTVEPGPNGMPCAYVNGSGMAYLHAKEHRFWQLNPGLRERLLQQTRADTLVTGNS